MRVLLHFAPFWRSIVMCNTCNALLICSVFFILDSFRHCRYTLLICLLFRITMRFSGCFDAIYYVFCALENRTWMGYKQSSATECSMCRSFQFLLHFILLIPVARSLLFLSSSYFPFFVRPSRPSSSLLHFLRPPSFRPLFPSPTFSPLSLSSVIFFLSFTSPHVHLRRK